MNGTGHRMSRTKECEKMIFTSLSSSVRKPHQYVNITQWLSLVVSSSSGAFENGRWSGDRIHRGERRYINGFNGMR